LSAVSAEPVKRPRLYQRFHYLLVCGARVNIFTEVKEAFEPAVFFPRGDNLLDSLFSDALYGGETKPDDGLFVGTCCFMPR
jgi:hypothetical protein